MNISLARQHYTMTKENNVSNSDQNAYAVKIAMQQLMDAMTILSKEISISEKEKNVEIALSRIYLLQKCLDFEAGGELAINLFRVYEHVRKELTNFIFAQNHDQEKDLTDAIAYIRLIHDAWCEITPNT